VFADRCQIEDELLFPVEVQQGIEGLLVVRRNRACPRPDRLGGKVQVLADVPGIHRKDAVCSRSVPPLHPVRDDAPEERDGPLPDEPLSETGLGDASGQIRFGELEQKAVLQRQVAVDPFLERLDIPAIEVRLERVPRTGGRDRAEGRLIAVPLRDPLGGPEEERQFFEGERRLSVSPDASAASKDPKEAGGADRVEPVRPRESDRPRVRGNGLLGRGWRDAARLVRNVPLDLLADRVLEPSPVGADQVVHASGIPQALDDLNTTLDYPRNFLHFRKFELISGHRGVII